MSRELVHVDRMPVIGMRHREHKVEHGSVRARWVAGRVPVLLEYARAVCERIPDRCVKPCDDRLEQRARRVRHRQELVPTERRRKLGKYWTMVGRRRAGRGIEASARERLGRAGRRRRWRVGAGRCRSRGGE